MVYTLWSQKWSITLISSSNFIEIFGFLFFYCDNEEGDDDDGNYNDYCLDDDEDGYDDDCCLDDDEDGVGESNVTPHPACQENPQTD